MEAVVNDPEQAALIAESRSKDDDDAEPWSPRLAEFGLTERLLRDAVLAIRGVQAAVIASASGKPARIEPYPMPRTEIARAVERANEQWAQSIIDIFTPGRGAGTN